MELFNKIKKLFLKEEQQTVLAPEQQVVEQEQEETQEEVTPGTKIKVVAALLVVGFAAYVAYWIQEPVEIRADVLGSGSTMQSETQSSTQAPSGTTQEVSISDFAFDPSTLSVDKGTTVVWTNKDSVPHSIVGDNFSSSPLNPGESYTYTFTSVGSFAYNCSFHPQMKGYVIVAGSSEEEVLTGFGAGTSLGLESGADETASQTMTEESASLPGETPSETPAETTAAMEPEQLYTNSASAPADELHGAALQSLSSSLSNVGNMAASSGESAQGSAALSAEQQAAATAQAQAQAQAQAAMADQKGKLASSGPEDVIYAGMFGLILYLNRRKLRNLHKSL